MTKWLIGLNHLQAENWQRFWGLLIITVNFLSDFAKMTAGLNAVKTKKIIRWNEKLVHCFNAVKTMFTLVHCFIAVKTMFTQVFR